MEIFGVLCLFIIHHFFQKFKTTDINVYKISVLMPLNKKSFISSVIVIIIATICQQPYFYCFSFLQQNYKPHQISPKL